MQDRILINKSNGYTLIELIVVFVIIVALFLASFPIYIASRNKIEFGQTINNISSLANEAVSASNNPGSEYKNAKAVCVSFNKNLNEMSIGSIPNYENSCSKSSIIKRIALGNGYGITCDSCSIALPVSGVSDIESTLSARINKGNLSKVVTVSSLGVVNVK